MEIWGFSLAMMMDERIVGEDTDDGGKLLFEGRYW